MGIRLTAMKSAFRTVSHILLAVLLCTFMSPTFAWEMLDSHGDENYATAMEDAPHQGIQPGAHHHHHHDDEGGGDAHSQIGHLLSHLPAMVHNAVIAVAVETGSGKVLTESPPFLQVEIAPPYKPPRVLLSV